MRLSRFLLTKDCALDLHVTVAGAVLFPSSTDFVCLRPSRKKCNREDALQKCAATTWTIVRFSRFLRRALRRFLFPGAPRRDGCCDARVSPLRGRALVPIEVSWQVSSSPCSALSATRPRLFALQHLQPDPEHVCSSPSARLPRIVSRFPACTRAAWTRARARISRCSCGVQRRGVCTFTHSPAPTPVIRWFSRQRMARTGYRRHSMRLKPTVHALATQEG